MASKDLRARWLASSSLVPTRRRRRLVALTNLLALRSATENMLALQSFLPLRGKAIFDFGGSIQILNPPGIFTAQGEVNFRFWPRYPNLKSSGHFYRSGGRQFAVLEKKVEKFLWTVKLAIFHRTFCFLIRVVAHIFR